jgi:hypothetical protein
MLLLKGVAGPVPTITPSPGQSESRLLRSTSDCIKSMIMYEIIAQEAVQWLRSNG